MVLAFKMLCNGDARVVSPLSKVWKILKTIHLGTGLKTADDFGKAVKSALMKIDDRANDILDKSAFTVAQVETEVELACATVKELTGKNMATLRDIFDAIRCIGDLCPAEAGPQLRLQYTDQPKGERLVIAMEPITDSDGGLRLFSVEHCGDGPWLSADFGDPDGVWSGFYRFVFLRRK